MDSEKLRSKQAGPQRRALHTLMTGAVPLLSGRGRVGS